MKKQINPSIKAHLIRGAFYLILLSGVCATPFALAQRNASHRNVIRSGVAAKDHSQFPKFPYSSVRQRPAGVTPTPTPSASPTPTDPTLKKIDAVAGMP